MYLTAQLLFR